MKYYFIIIMLFIIGCTSAIQDASLFFIEYKFIDKPERRKIQLQYKNNLNKPVCLLPEFWPNIAGKINQAGHEVFLIVNEQRFPILDFNTGYCSGCVLKVIPGKEVVRFIGYNDFNLPENLMDKPKKLEFSPKGYFCK